MSAKSSDLVICRRQSLTEWSDRKVRAGGRGMILTTNENAVGSDLRVWRPWQDLLAVLRLLVAENGIREVWVL